MTPRRLLVIFAALVAALTALVNIPASAQSDTVTITILHNNDGESKLLPSDDQPGIAAFVAALKEMQANNDTDGVVTVTSGDNFLASKEFSVSLDKGAPFYDSIALGGLYDAMALGNHDFDFGPEVTAQFISGFNPSVPFLSANIDVSGEPDLAALEASGDLAASTVVDVAGTQVGIIGLITPRLPNISSPRNVVVNGDLAAIVNAEAATLEGQGVNKIILISHLQGVEQDKMLLPNLVGVDAAVIGGGDELLKNDGDTCLPDDPAAGSYPTMIGDIPAVTGPGNYQCIGALDLTFDTDGNLVASSGQQVGVPIGGAADATVQANVEVPLTAALDAMSTNVVATSEIELDGRRENVRTRSTNEGSLVADALLAMGQKYAASFGAPTPVVAIQNGGGIRNDSILPAGDITESDTFDIVPFGNRAVIVAVPRQRFKEVLENAVSGYPEAEGRFAQPAGFTIAYDPEGEPREIDHDGDCSLIGTEGARIVDVELDDGTKIISGGNVVDGPDVVLTIGDFLANGGDCYPLSDLDQTAIGLSDQGALKEYISETLGGTISEAQYGGAAPRITQTTVDPMPPTPTPTPVIDPVAPTPTPLPTPVIDPVHPTPTPVVIATPTLTPIPTPTPETPTIPGQNDFTDTVTTPKWLGDNSGGSTGGGSGSGSGGGHEIGFTG